MNILLHAFLKCELQINNNILIIFALHTFRADKTNNDGFWTKKKKYISEKRFVLCYTYEKPNPVQLGTYDAVVSVPKHM